MGIIKKREAYIAKAIGLDARGNKMYSKPYLVKGALEPAKGYRDLVSYGERTNKMFKMLLPYEAYKTIKEGDKVYLNEALEFKDELMFGFNANYVVYSVRPQNIKTIVYFEKIV